MRTVTTIDTTTIEDLDFPITCEHPQHEEKHPDEPAKYIVLAHHPECGHLRRYPICHGGWVYIMNGKTVWCSTCHATGILATDVLRIIEVLP
jgi:hypothetical protein